MKTLLFILALPTILLASGNWFVEPTASKVWLQSSGMSYHSYDGRAFYNDGYSVGLNAGRYFYGDKIKTYISYDYTESRANRFQLYTPYGTQTQADRDLWHNHTVKLNADYRGNKLIGGLQPYIGLGTGLSFDDTTSEVIEGRIGVARSINRNTLLSVEYGYRKTFGTLDYNTIKIKEPDQNRVTLSIGWRF